MEKKDKSVTIRKTKAFLLLIQILYWKWRGTLKKKIQELEHERVQILLNTSLYSSGTFGYRKMELYAEYLKLYIQFLRQFVTISPP